MNTVVLVGRLTKDPVLEYVGQNQTARTRFTLAVDRDYDRENADFIRITTFGKIAENCDRYLDKGRLVGVAGRIQTGSYENRNGETVYTQDVIAERVQFLGGGSYKQEEREEPGSGVEVPTDWDAGDTFSMAEDDIPF